MSRVCIAIGIGSSIVSNLLGAKCESNEFQRFLGEIDVALHEYKGRLRTVQDEVLLKRAKPLVRRGRLLNLPITHQPIIVTNTSYLSKVVMTLCVQRSHFQFLEY